jgi:D-sedoheptulose 7-phosphate isomerase
MQDVILNTLKESIAVKDASIKANRDLLEKGAGRLAECLVSGHKVTTDTSIITSIGNDYNFNEIFVKQLKALGNASDIAWAISTSGNSQNVIVATQEARKIGMFTMAMTGRGGELASVADLILKVNSNDTARIQETQITMAHILCDLVDRILFPDAQH